MCLPQIGHVAGAAGAAGAGVAGVLLLVGIFTFLWWGAVRLAHWVLPTVCPATVYSVAQKEPLCLRIGIKALKKLLNTNIAFKNSGLKFHISDLIDPFPRRYLVV
jgi:hypothetical protein